VAKPTEKRLQDREESDAESDGRRPTGTGAVQAKRSTKEPPVKKRASEAVRSLAPASKSRLDDPSLELVGSVRKKQEPNT
jgi:hypothetical protein